MISDLRINEGFGKVDDAAAADWRERGIPNRRSVFIEPVKPRVSAGTIIIPDTAGAKDEKDAYGWEGRIVRLGALARDEGNMKVGDRVIYARGAACRDMIPGIDIVARSAVMAVIEGDVEVIPCRSS